jgi:nucleotide-binding universal stress UspA family protein
MKTILIPAEDHDAMPAVLAASLAVARTFDSYIEGFAVRPSAGTYVTVEPVSSLAISGAYDGDAARNAQAAFESFMKSNGVPPAAGEGGVLSYSWPMQEAAEDSFIGSHGRVFDLIVLGRPGRAAENPRMPPLEAALFESGKPVLVVPRRVPASIGKNVLIAWNRSTEQANTNGHALPLLRLAEQVTVLTVEGGSVSGPSGEDAARHLRRNGVKAKAVTVDPGARSAGEVILERAAALGCDLLVKCAYTQSRLRQMIFGGATRHILGHATLPVFMAH